MSHVGGTFGYISEDCPSAWRRQSLGKGRTDRAGGEYGCGQRSGRKLGREIYDQIGGEGQGKSWRYLGNERTNERAGAGAAKVNQL